MTDISGCAAAGFQPAVDAFGENFASRGEAGAAFCAYAAGERVVDVWAGEAAPGRPWAEDTLAPVFSVTKGAAALCAQILADRGRLDVGAPVADYWPEFAARGKSGVLVRHVLSHTAGLPSFPRYWETVSFDRARGWRRTDEIAARLAEAPLAWEPGTRIGYHPITFGWLVGELVRRIDGRTLGIFFREEAAAPLGLEFWIGLPPDRRGRVAELLSDPAPESGPAAALGGPGNPAGEALFIGPEGGPPINMGNDPVFWSAEMPAVNGVADARSVARMYAMLSGGGELDGVRIVSEESIAAHSAEQARGTDAIFGGESRTALGYGRPAPGGMSMGPNDEAFGMQGLGGALGYADPVAEVGFGYVMNQTRMEAGTDRRARALSKALYRSIG